jgi:hypothetical protein
VTKLEDIATAVFMDRHDVSDVLAELAAMKVVQVVEDVVFEPLPDASKWQVQRRWRTDAQRAKGEAMVQALMRFQGIEQAELLAPEPDLDSALGEVSRESAQRGIAQLPALHTTHGWGHRENASPLAVSQPVGKTKREQALELRAQIAQSLREAGWSEEELRSLDGVPVEQLNRWASHPPTGGESPTKAVGESPTVPRAGARASTGTIGIGTNGNGTIGSNGSDASQGQKRQVDSGVMHQLRELVGEKNAGYWHETIERDGAIGDVAAFKALTVWREKKNKQVADVSRYLMGIYRRMLRELRTTGTAPPRQGVSLAATP